MLTGAWQVLGRCLAGAWHVHNVQEQEQLLRLSLSLNWMPAATDNKTREAGVNLWFSLCQQHLHLRRETVHHDYSKSFEGWSGLVAQDAPAKDA